MSSETTTHRVTLTRFMFQRSKFSLVQFCFCLDWAQWVQITWCSGVRDDSWLISESRFGLSPLSQSEWDTPPSEGDRQVMSESLQTNSSGPVAFLCCPECFCLREVLWATVVLFVWFSTFWQTEAAETKQLWIKDSAVRRVQHSSCSETRFSHCYIQHLISRPEWRPSWLLQ